MNIQNFKRILRLLFLTISVSLLMNSCGVLPTKQDYAQKAHSNRHEILVIASSEGVVNSYSFNPIDFKAEHTGSFTSPMPSSLVINRTDDVLYIANNTSEKATITATKFNKFSGELSEINQSYVVGHGPVAIDLFDNKLVSANEVDGSITLFMLDKILGSLSEAEWRIDLGDGAVSFPVDATFSIDGNHLFVTDKGQDKIFHFLANNNVPPLSIDHRTVSFPEKSRPVQMIFDQSGKYAYVICEDDPNIYHFAYNNGDLEMLNKYDTHRPFDAKGTSIAIHPRGNFLYTTYSGATGGIAVFGRNPQTGALKRIENQKIGLHPVKCTISPSGDFVAIAAEGASQVEIHKLNPISGLLSQTISTINIFRPTDVIWKSIKR